MKRCRKCQSEKSDDKFYALKRNSDGLHSYCKQCCRESSKKYREENADQVKKRNREWYLNNRDYAIVKAKQWTARNQEKSRQIWKESASRRRKAGKMRKYHVDISDVIEKWGTVCYLCGTDIDMSAPRSCAKSGWENGLHIDHVVPRVLGGADSVENLRPTHGLCNIKKKDKEVEVNDKF